MYVAVLNNIADSIPLNTEEIKMNVYEVMQCLGCKCGHTERRLPPAG